MASDRGKKLFKAPALICAFSEISILIILIYHWEHHTPEYVTVNFSYLVVLLLIVRCFLFRSLEYLLSMFIVNALQMLVALRFLKTKSLFIYLHLYIGGIRTAVCAVLLYLYSPIFKHSGYFVYGARDSNRVIVFESYIFRSLMEIQLANYITEQFVECHYLIISKKHPSFIQIVILACTKITMCIQVYMYSTKKPAIGYFIAFIWFCYALYYKIIRYSIDMCNNCSEMHKAFGVIGLFWKEFYILNVIAVAVSLVHLVWNNKGPKEIPIMRVNSTLTRIPIQ